MQLSEMRVIRQVTEAVFSFRVKLVAGGRTNGASLCYGLISAPG